MLNFILKDVFPFLISIELDVKKKINNDPTINIGRLPNIVIRFEFSRSSNSYPNLQLEIMDKIKNNLKPYKDENDCYWISEEWMKKLFLTDIGAYRMFYSLRREIKDLEELESFIKDVESLNWRKRAISEITSDN